MPLFALHAIAAAALAGAPTPCAHDLGTPRPRLTAAEQAETRQLLRVAVDHLGGSRDFAALLELVAARESSLQRGLVHRLAADQDANANASALARLRGVYEGNPYTAEPARWQGYGLFGFNAAIFTRVWDPQADPRVLCDAVVDVLVYQRAAARTVAKLRRTGRCAPTWANVHAAVSGGRLCPPAERTVRFRRRAARAGLNPDREVTTADLGHSPRQVDQQAELVRLRRAVNMRPAGAS